MYCIYGGDAACKSNIFMEFETTMACNGCPEHKPQPWYAVQKYLQIQQRAILLNQCLSELPTILYRLVLIVNLFAKLQNKVFMYFDSIRVVILTTIQR